MVLDLLGRFARSTASVEKTVLPPWYETAVKSASYTNPVCLQTDDIYIAHVFNVCLLGHGCYNFSIMLAMHIKILF